MGIWNSKKKNEWDQALQDYDEIVIKNNLSSLDARVSTINADSIRRMDADTFAKYLYNEFYYWKYHNTASAMNIKSYREAAPMTNEEIEPIRTTLSNCENDDETLLESAQKIKGLGLPGATALLSLLYPSRFGTVDGMVVRALKEDLSSNARIQEMNEKKIIKSDALYVVELMKGKAADLNRLFGYFSWTPRTIDKAIWASANRRKILN